MSIVLTRPQNEDLIQACQAHQWDYIEAPVFERHVLPAPSLTSAYDLIFFINPFVVRLFAQSYTLRDSVVGAVGQSTRQALQDYGFSHIIHSSTGQDSEHFWQTVQQIGLERFKKVLIVRATTGKQWLAQQFQQQGVQVDYLPLYERVERPWGTSLRERLQQGTHVYLVTSTQALSTLQHYWQTYRLLPHVGAVIVTHPRMQMQLQSVLPQAIPVICSEPQESAIIKTIAMFSNTMLLSCLC